MSLFRFILISQTISRLIAGSAAGKMLLDSHPKNYAALLPSDQSANSHIRLQETEVKAGGIYSRWHQPPFRTGSFSIKLWSWGIGIYSERARAPFHWLGVRGWNEWHAIKGNRARTLMNGTKIFVRSKSYVVWLRVNELSSVWEICFYNT